MDLIALPTQPCDVPWPIPEWSRGEPQLADASLIEHLVDSLFNGANPDLGRTDAFVVVHGGRVVIERYGEGIDAGSTLISWSMAKSMTAVLFAKTDLDPMAPAPVPEWNTPGDPRAAITARDLLTMTSGLEWAEVYSPDEPSDVVEMLFGEAKSDAAGFAASKPLAHEPGTSYLYSSGTTNIVSRFVGARLAAATGASPAEAIHRSLFEPLAMTSATPKFDQAGTFIGSSFVYATALDFARFGLFCLRGGQWNGEQLVAEGWIDTCRTPTEASRGVDRFVHGAHFWCHEDRYGTFGCHGYDGQYIWMNPTLDLVTIRLGSRPEDRPEVLIDVMQRIVSGFDGTHQ